MTDEQLKAAAEAFLGVVSASVDMPYINTGDEEEPEYRDTCIDGTFDLIEALKAALAALGIDHA
jgi:hypothetical protein